ncbi:MAG: RagB/SusD family nutrient uptake outer membrane protein [Prevotella sp.]|nr:RagB/SusD family nutrient uptake outer membrane protein [Prevotella sp.]
MKLSNIKYMSVAALFGLAVTSCSEFLEKPNEDGYNVDNYYQTDDQCYSGVNYLYNSPWYDFQRGFIKVGEVLSGNYYWGSSPYMNFSVNGSDQDLVNMSYSLWAVIGHANTVYDNLKGASASQAAINQCMGECLTWKAFAYFFLVRSFGDVPIIHSTAEEMSSGAYSTTLKVKRSDVYEYIIMTLEKAMELLMKEAPQAGRIDYYCAEALLAKVYLTKAGVTGTLNAGDLSKAAAYAKDVIDNSGRSLLENYADVWKLTEGLSSESMIAWRWTVGANWTSQNTLQSDLAMEGMDEFGDDWGGWNGLSVDLQEAFGIKLLENQPDAWLNNIDTRLKATMFLPGFTYDYLWKDHGGYDYLKFIYDNTYNEAATGSLQAATGANCVKHLYGNTQDHKDALNIAPARMSYALPTHILRLSDVYLIYAEAMLGAGRTTSTNADVLDAFYAVHHRAVPTANYPASVSWEDIWKERRLEFAMEGDRWYDYVRVSYYDPDFCVKELTAQKRNSFWGLDALYKAYFNTGSWNIDPSKQGYDSSTAAPNVNVMLRTDSEVSNKGYFALPMSAEDVLFNPNLGSNVEGEHVDVRATYSY